MSLDALFDSMATAEGSSSGVFFTEGVYKVALKEIDYKPAGYKGKSCIFRFTVTESNNPEHPVGATRVWICKLDKSRDENVRTLADIKSLIFALGGKSIRDVGSAEANPKAHEQATKMFKAALDATFAKQEGIDPAVLFGREAKLEALKIPTKPKTPGGPPGEYTRHVWG